MLFVSALGHVLLLSFPHRWFNTALRWYCFNNAHHKQEARGPKAGHPELPSGPQNFPCRSLIQSLLLQGFDVNFSESSIFPDLYSTKTIKTMTEKDYILFYINKKARIKTWTSVTQFEQSVISLKLRSEFVLPSRRRNLMKHKIYIILFVSIQQYKLTLIVNILSTTTRPNLDQNSQLLLSKD